MNNLHKNIKGVIFDMDGTLLDSMGIWEDFMDKFRSRNNITQEINLYELIEDMDMRQIAEYISKNYDINKTGKEILDEWDDILIEYHKTQVFLKEGVKEYLDYLKSNNIKMCIASESGSNIIKAMLDIHNLHDYFEFYISSKDENIGIDKTDKFIYMFALNKLGVTKDECLIYEDAYYAAKTACEAGFNVVGVYDYYSQKNNSLEEKLTDLKLVRYLQSMKELLSIEK